MHRDGCTDAVQVGGQGDLGADVKATDPYGRRWVIQCKHRKNGDRGAAVGTPDLQVLNGTGRPVHRADVVVMVTNGRITRPGRAFARQQRLHLVDRQVLAQWATGSRPLWELLGAVAIASNESFGGWTETFTDPRLCTAIVDRLTFNDTIIETGTDSYRLAHTRSKADRSAAT
ncbi:restriction endonuclease [Streptomyces prasinosporus]